MSAANQLSHYLGPWTEKQIRHLLIRTLFGVTQADLAYFKGKSLDECVNLLLLPATPPPPPMYRLQEDANVPTGTSPVLAAYDKIRDEDRTIFLKAQWVSIMLSSAKNITEKMVLFWHNHFVIQFSTVSDARYHYQYLQILRKNATGNFKKLLREITVTPGMLVYLNGNLNDKSTPNENYGRELQELFTVGKGPDSHYTEADVKAAAKVLTGWKDDKKNIRSYFNPDSHNTEDKIFSDFYGHHVIKGKSGIDGAKETDELVDMICSNPEVSKFLCRKLYRWFVHSKINEEVEKNIIAPLAVILRQSNYEIKPVLKALFTSVAFYDSNLVGSMFKSPVDYFIGLIREMDMEICVQPLNNGLKNNLGGLFMITLMLEEMGQNLGNPPNVAGWPAYCEFPAYDKNWVNSENLSARSRAIKGISYFEEEVFNTQPNPHLAFHFTKFVSHLPDPGDPHLLVSDTFRLLMQIQPTSSGITYVQQFLGPSKESKYTWAELWAKHKKETNTATTIETENRLKKAFNVILMLPEYQIM